ncbi:MAG TPA: ABC transporter permease [Gemmatimonadaceae bacterium]|jgi:putative ABC transport system permease protein|nr:ABC transporter permease [Gemmatimonadaceae bacterium]
MTAPAQRVPNPSGQPEHKGGLHRPEIPAASITLAKEIMLVAMGALRANKMRSFLTMLGIVIGVAAVIAMVAIGKGAQKSISDRIAGLGTTLLSVRPGARRGFGVATENNEKLTIEDAEALERRGKNFAAVGPEMNKRLLIQYGSLNAQTQVTGAKPVFPEIRKFNLAAGRFFNDQEEAGMRRVAVVGSSVITNLGLQTPEAILGENVRIGGLQFQVIGVFESKGQTGGFGNDPDDIVIIPLSTARYRLFGTPDLNSISVLAATEQQIPEAQAEIQSILRRQHRLTPDKRDDFDIRNQAEFLNTFAETTKTFTFLLAGIAAVSLLVGGIGIMNIMLVSVTERTREIGVRKALGATKVAILFQFLIEAIVLCLLGGLIGVLLGAGGAFTLSKLGGFNTTVDISSVILAFVFSATVGVLFGVWPARRAASLDPIIALRYE